MISPAYAHDSGQPVTALANAWTLDPLVLVPMILGAWLYWRGVRSTWQRAGAGRGVTRWQAASFAAGFVALVFALIWPLDVLGEELFSAHMAQHLLLMNVAAPLIVLGAPLGPMLRALSRAGQRAAGAIAGSRGWRSAWRFVSGVWPATVLQLVMLWAWHTPRGLAAALASDGMHIAMHVSLMIAALIFWTAMLKPRSRDEWHSIAALLVTLKLTGVASILLLLHAEPLYYAYADSAARWGLTPADDERMGWGVMMLVGTVSYLVAGVALAARALARLPSAHAMRIESVR